MNETPRPIIEIPEYDINTKYTYVSISILSKEDNDYLNVWRDKARRKYKKIVGHYNIEDEQYLIDPDPFTDKWFIFSIKRKPTPKPSPILTSNNANNKHINYSLKGILNVLHHSSE